MPAFGAPWFLYFAAAAVAPVIIHLVYGLRHKRVPTGALWMIRRILEHNARRLRLRDLLLLLLRVAAVVLLVLAFARPVGWSLHSLGGKAVVIVDDSYPMREVLPGGNTLFEETLDDLIPRLAGDTFHLFTLSGQGEGEFSSLGALTATLERTKPAAVAGDLAAALGRASAVQDAQRAYAVVGEWQGLVGAPPVIRTPLEYLNLARSTPGCRLTFEGAAALPEGKGLSISIRVTDPRALPHVVRLFRLLEGGRKEEIVSRPAPEPGLVVLRAENLPQKGTVMFAAMVDGRDGLPIDDTAYMAVELLPPVRVAVIVNRMITPEFLSPSFYVRTALMVGSGFTVDEYPAKEMMLAAQRSEVLVFTEQALVPTQPSADELRCGWMVFAYGDGQTGAGGTAGGDPNLSIAPRAALAEGQLVLDKDFTPFERLGAEAFADIDWGSNGPIVLGKGAWKPAVSIGEGARIIRREALDGEGRRLIIAAPPDRRFGSDFPLHKVFVPVIREGAAWTALRTSAGGVQEKLRLTGEVWDLPTGTARVLGADGSALEVQAIAGKPAVRLMEPGIHTALVSEAGGAEQLVIAANLASAGGVEPLSEDVFKTLFVEAGAVEAREEKPDPAAGPWRILAAIVVAILVVEALLSAAPIVRAKPAAPESRE